MAGFNVDPAAVAKARAVGYTDDEIVDHLSAQDPARFKQASDAGYSSKEILEHLARPQDTGVVAGLREGVSDAVSGVGKTLKDFAGVETTPTLDKISDTARSGNYKPAQVVPEDGHWYDPTSYNWSQVPQAIAESAPGMAADITAARMGSKVAGLKGGIAAGLASYALRKLGINAEQRAASRTGDSEAKPTTEDKTIGALTTAAESIPAAVGVSRFIPGLGKAASVGARGILDSAKRLATTTAVEAGVGGAQDVANQVGMTAGTPGGIQIDPNRVANSAVTSGLTGGTLAAPRGIAEASSAVKYRDFGGSNKEAAAAFANRVQTAADGKSLKDVRTGFDAVEAATKDVKNELADAVSRVKKETQLSPEADNALTRAVSKEKLTPSDVQHVERAVAGTAEADNILSLAKQASVAARLREKGFYKSEGDSGGKFTGGISGVLDNKVRAIYNPISTLASPALGIFGSHLPGVFGMYSLPALGTLYGGYAAARGFDSITGARSPAQGFVRRFADPSVAVRQGQDAPPSPVPAGTSVPQIAPPQAMPWGYAQFVPPQPKYNPRPNIIVDEGIAKITKRLASEKKRDMVAEALPELRRLAKTRDAPERLPDDFSSMLRSKEEPIDLPNPLAPKAAPEPEASTTVDPKVLTRSRALMRALANVEKLKNNTIGQSEADSIARNSPLINDVGGLGAVANPAIGKRASSLISAANAIKRLTAEPEEQTTGIKKRNGKVREETAAPKEEPVEDTFTPLTEAQLRYRGKSDDYVANAETTAFGDVRMKERYKEGIVRDRKARRNALAEVAAEHEGDADTIAALLEELHHRRNRREADSAVKHYTSLMSPEAAAAVRSKVDSKFINAIWRQR